MTPTICLGAKGQKKGVCKTRTGYLRMADADGKTRMEKCGWKKIRITKKVRRKKKREMRMAKKINKQKTKERNLSFKSLSRGWTLHLHTECDAIVDTVLYHIILNIFPCKKNMFGCINVTEIRTLRSSSLNAHIRTWCTSPLSV